MPPNVLLLVVDSLRADAVFDPRPPTPVLDEVVRSGASFRQCIASATVTTPSFASMLTGCYLPKHGVRALRGFSLSNRIGRTLPEVFSAAGYHTVAEATGPLFSETGVFRGFEVLRHRSGHDAPFMGWRDEMVATIRSLPSPWLMLLHVWEVHRPYRSPPDFKKRYARSGYEGALTAMDSALAPVFDVAGDDSFVVVTGDHGEAYAESWLGDRYAALLRDVRRKLKVGRWAPGLERKLAARAVGHGFTLDEALVRVPLVIAGPGISPRTIPDQVRHVDLFPTLAELSGLDPGDGLDGRSLVGAMRGRTLAAEPAYMECSNVAGGDQVAGVRTESWKLIRERGDKIKLHRLDGPRGPDERRNVAADHPDVVEEMSAYMSSVLATESSDGPAALTQEEEEIVEERLRNLGYL